MNTKPHHHVLRNELSEIVLRIESYDDIFSDFDVRPYSSRSLSVDFLDEIKRATRDKQDDGIVLTMCVMQRRSGAREAVIRERLLAHFRKYHRRLITEKRRLLRVGYMMVGLGALCMIIASFIIYKTHEQSFVFSVLLLFLEPAAWFLLWEGMDQLIFNSKKLDNDLNFYHKMSDPHSNIRFKTC